MKITVQKEYEFDIKKEKKRLKKCFKGAKLKRQLKLLDVFILGEFGTWIELFHELPYDDNRECTEREYVGMEIYRFMRDTMYDNLKVIKIEGY